MTKKEADFLAAQAFFVQEEKDKTLLGKNQGALWQYKHHFRFGEDSVLLAHFAADFMKKRGPSRKTVFDLCAGSGVIGVLFFRLLQQEMHLAFLEYAPKMLALLSCNQQENQLENVDIFQGDLAAPFSTWRLYEENPTENLRKNLKAKSADVLLLNPPYARKNQSLISKEMSEEEKMARFEMQGKLSQYLVQCAKLLKEGAFLFVCLPPHRMNELCFYAMREGLFLDTLRWVHPYQDREAKLVLFAFKKAKIETQVKVLPPLILRQKDGSYTQEVALWYAEENFSSEKP